MTSGTLRIVLVTPNYANNSLGRTFCHWLLGRSLGWDVTTVGVRGEQLWKPLRDSEFAESCVNLSNASETVARTTMRGLVADADLVIAVKPLRTSLALAAPLADELARPLVVDIDDPDLEVRSAAWPLLRRQAPRTTVDRRREVRQLRSLLAGRPVMVSNPVLQRSYGGLVLPHVRPSAPRRPATPGRDVVVRFVGSPRPHKGLAVLRQAVATLGGTGVRLEVTAPAPGDERPWETWLGETDIARGQELVQTADIVALPSLRRGYANAQLPAKLMDAMVAGRAVVASNLAPVAWALGQTGLLVPPGDVLALAEAINSLRDQGCREALGSAAHVRAESMFTVEAVAAEYASFVESVLSGSASAPPVPQEGL